MSELGPEARSILDGGRDGDDPTPADRKRVRAAVLQAIAVGSVTALGSATAAGAAGASAGGTLLGIGWKTLAATLALGALGTVTVVASSAMKAPTTASATSPSSAASSNGTEGLVVAAPRAPGPQAKSADVDAPSSVAAPPAIAASAPSTPALHPASETASAKPLVQPKAPRVDTSPATVAQEEPTEADTLRAETQRLRDAQSALKGGDPSRALALLDEHGSAGAQLREERAAGRVFALCDLGRVDEARAAAAKFLAESPRSPLADRVRSSCASR